VSPRASWLTAVCGCAEAWGGMAQHGGRGWREWRRRHTPPGAHTHARVASRASVRSALKRAHAVAAVLKDQQQPQQCQPTCVVTGPCDWPRALAALCGGGRALRWGRHTLVAMWLT
jgi:hypothetical protein